MTVGSAIGSIGRGLGAGLFGTGVMTVVQMIEMKLQHREMSDAPAKAVEKLTAIEPRTEKGEKQLAQATHFAYGTAWGGVRGLLGALGLPNGVANLAHLGLVSGAAAMMLPRLGLAEPVSEWSKKEVATDLLHHGVYALATGLAYGWLERRARMA